MVMTRSLGTQSEALVGISLVSSPWGRSLASGEGTHIKTVQGHEHKEVETERPYVI